MIAAGDLLERIGAYGEAWQLLADAALIRNPAEIPEWSGEDISRETLLVERRVRHTGAELRMARFLGGAARKASEVIACVEPRLVALLRRSLPEVTVVEKSDAVARKRATRGASYERVAQFVAENGEAIRASFRPLRPPPEIVAQLRARRSASPRPMVGIAWYSSNQRKQLPALEDWSDLIRRFPGTYISLQYDEDSCSLDRLRDSSGRPVEGAQGIDQIADMDAFAGQVASVDIVVTISNTTAHMAGALGVPCLVLLDDLDHLFWPQRATKTPFYPATRLIRAGHRPWSRVFESIPAEIESCMDGQG
jgi:hypothetical protein